MKTTFASEVVYLPSSRTKGRFHFSFSLVVFLSIILKDSDKLLLSCHCYSLTFIMRRGCHLFLTNFRSEVPTESFLTTRTCRTETWLYKNNFLVWSGLFTFLYSGEISFLTFPHIVFLSIILKDTIFVLTKLFLLFCLGSMTSFHVMFRWI